MQFFLMMPGDSEEDTLNEANLLGEASFGTFWAGTGLTILMRMVDKDPDMLPLVKIATDMSKKLHTVEQFLTVIQKHKIRIR